MNRYDTLELVYIENLQTDKHKAEVLDLLLRNTEDFKPSRKNEFTPLSLEDYIERYVNTLNTLIILKLNNYVVGVSILKLDALIANFEEKEENLLVEFSLIDKGFRNLGLGKILYREVEDLNKYELHRPVIVRGIIPTNEVQQHLFHKLGYSLLEETKGTPRNLYYKNVTNGLVENPS